MLHLQTFRGKILVHRDGGGLPVAEMDEQEACRRIISAPDLLAALEGLLRATQDLTGERWEEVGAARAAIAKARGR